MGKGDKKTKRGKIILGSSGVRRPKDKKKKTDEIIIDKKVEKTEKLEKTEKKPAKKTKKTIETNKTE